jgi:hypothetical protein
MKHIAIAGIAALVAAVVSLVLATYGAHDLPGLFAVMVGYPGAFANWRLEPGGPSYLYNHRR